MNLIQNKVNINHWYNNDNDNKNNNDDGNV